jgi:two-component system chemotaxis response regulator CheB
MAMLKKTKGTTIAQNKETSLIYGMPKAVAEEGNADLVLPLDRVVEGIVKSL